MSIASEITRINNNIAAAYIACSDKGAALPQAQNSANLADTIDSIPSGSGAEILPKYVNFVDYDGTILYSYTQAELQSLSALPPLPQRDGLTCTGWNRTLQSLKANDLPDTVGAIYSPSDGATKLTFDLSDKESLSVNFSLSAVSRTIDWGDGTVVTNSDTSVSHSYTSPGEYTVKITADPQAQLSIYNFPSYSNGLTEAVLSDNIVCPTNRMFINCYSLEKVSIPSSLTALCEQMFINCISLRHISFPAGVMNLSKYIFQGCTSLKSVSLSGGITSIPAFAFNNCYLLKRITLPSTVTTTGESSFAGCRSLHKVIIPSGFTVFYNTYGFDASSLEAMDLSALTSVPVLQYSNTFSSSVAKYYVRNAEMLAAFQSATNWSHFASKMQIGGKYAD